MRTLIIDDEYLGRSLLRKYAERIEDLEVIGECENGFEAVKSIDELKPDLIFLDVQMPKLSGLEVLELINEPTRVIFCTAFDQYAVEAFNKKAIDYLLKPFLFERFEQAVNRARENHLQDWKSSEHLADLNSSSQRIVIKDGDKINLIDHENVFYLEAYDDYVKIHTNQGRFIKKQTMAFYEKNLPSQRFIRIHRSFIVSLDHILRIESIDKSKYQVVLKNEISLPISRNAYPGLKELLGW